MFRDSPECFLILPHDDRGASIQSLLHKLLQEQGVQVISVDNIYSQGSIVGTFLRAIERAHFVIADISDQNPNALFELGAAFGLRKRLLILGERQTVESLSDLHGQQIIAYDPEDTALLRKYIGHWVEEAIAKVFLAPT